MAGCSTVRQTQDAAIYGRSRWAVPVKQDANLYKVDARLYRSEQLVRDDIAQIERLSIQSIVNLRFFDRNDDRQLLGERGFNLINSPLLTWHIKPKNIAETLYLIEASQQSGPVSVHCYHGADRTGLIVGRYRIIYQGWPVEAAKQEMQQGPYGYHSIWKNIDKLFNQEKVDEVKVHLNMLRMQQVFRQVEMPV